MYKILVPLVTLGMFSMLAGYSMGRWSPAPKHETARPVVLKRSTINRVPVKEQARIIGEIWHIAPGEEMESITFFAK